jgi:cell division septation protein DedD
MARVTRAGISAIVAAVLASSAFTAAGPAPYQELIRSQGSRIAQVGTGQGSLALQTAAAPARSRPQDAKKPRYAIQVGATENRIEADDLALKVASTTKLPALVQPATVHDRKFFRVRVYAHSRAESRRLSARLRRAGFRTWIVPLP